MIVSSVDGATNVDIERAGASINRFLRDLDTHSLENSSFTHGALLGTGSPFLGVGKRSEPVYDFLLPPASHGGNQVTGITIYVSGKSTSRGSPQFYVGDADEHLFDLAENGTRTVELSGREARNLLRSQADELGSRLEIGLLVGFSEQYDLQRIVVVYSYANASEKILEKFQKYYSALNALRHYRIEMVDSLWNTGSYSFRNHYYKAAQESIALCDNLLALSGNPIEATRASIEIIEYLWFLGDVITEAGDYVSFWNLYGGPTPQQVIRELNNSTTALEKVVIALLDHGFSSDGRIEDLSQINPAIRDADTRLSLLNNELQSVAFRGNAHLESGSLGSETAEAVLLSLSPLLTVEYGTHFDHTQGFLPALIDSINEFPEFSISPPSRNHPATRSGNHQISVSSNVSWTASRGTDSWITIESGSSGSGDGTVRYRVAANLSSSPRTGTIVVGGEGLAETFVVSQEGVEITLTPTSGLHAAGSGSHTFSVSSNAQWSAHTGEDWISLGGSDSGSGDGEVDYSVDANASTSSRTGWIAVGSGSVTRHFRVDQEGASAELEINPESASFSEAGGTGTISVSANVPWDYESDSGWITVTGGGSSVSNDGQVEFSVDENHSIESRSGEITFAGGSKSRYFEVEQDGAPPELDIDPREDDFPASGGRGSISVTSNTSWNVETDETWIVLSHVDGSKSGIIEYEVLETDSPGDRTGRITVAAEDLVRELIVRQEGAILEINPEGRQHDPEAGRGSVSVTSNVSWRASSEENWIQIEGANAGVGDGTVRYGIALNGGEGSRSGTITISTFAGLTREFSVDQEAGDDVAIRISNIEELQRIGNDADYPRDGTYVLTQDIDAAETEEWHGGAGFLPIGARTRPFIGVFDGNGYNIQNIFINQRDFIEEEYWLSRSPGLFDTIGRFGVVRNLHLEDGVVKGGRAGALAGTNGGVVENCSASSEVIGSDPVGGLVALNFGEITRSHSIGPLTGYSAIGGLVGVNEGEISLSYAKGSVAAKDRNAGGLAGRNYGIISTSFAAGTVKGNSRVGGLVGSNRQDSRTVGAITDCYATALVIGRAEGAGLVGENRGEIVRSYASGPIEAEEIGGLIGVGSGQTGAANYWDRDTTRDATAGIDVGESRSTEEMMMEETFEGWDFEETWEIVEGQTYPRLRGVFTMLDDVEIEVSGENGEVQLEPGEANHLPGSVVWLSAEPDSGFEFVGWKGAGMPPESLLSLNPLPVIAWGSKTLEAVFVNEESWEREITNLEDLSNIGRDPDWPLDGHYTLTADIDGSESAEWNDGAGFDPIGSEERPFEGVFEGNSYTIVGLTIDRPEQFGVGLFAVVGNDAEIRGLHLEGGKVHGNGRVGSVAGSNNGMIAGCSSTAAVDGNSYVAGLAGTNSGEIMRSYATGPVNGGRWVGGVVGRNSGNLVETMAAGSVAGESNVGGLAGEQWGGSVENSFALGPVFGRSATGALVGTLMAGEIAHSYAAGLVQSDGGSSAGLVGNRQSGTVSASFWDVETTGVDRDEIEGGKTSAEMFAQETYGGWDFEETWIIGEDGAYPWLRAFSSEPEPIEGTKDATNGCVSTVPIESEHWEAIACGGSEFGIYDTPENFPWPLVWLTAEPDPGYEFAGWVEEGLSGGVLVTANPLPVTGRAFSEPIDLQAIFIPAGPIEIDSIEDLAKIGNDPEWPLHWSYVLSADIDASETAEWNDGRGFEPIGGDAGFTGHLDGQGHAISGLVIDRQDEGWMGLFARIGKGGIVENFSIEGGSVKGSQYSAGAAGENFGTISEVSSSINVEGGAAPAGGLVAKNRGTIVESESSGDVTVSVWSDFGAGGLVGENDGKILDSFASGQVSGEINVGGLVGKNRAVIHGSRATGWVSAHHVAGGLVGRNEGEISLGFATGRVEADQEAGGLVGSNRGDIETSFATGTVVGEWQVGGLVGDNSGTVADAFSSGFVVGEAGVGGLAGSNLAGEITRSYASGLVSGNWNTGGLAGGAPSEVLASYWDVETTGVTTSSGGMGKQTVEMLSEASYSGWDFDETWMLTEGSTYPSLQGFSLDSGDITVVAGQGGDVGVSPDIADHPAWSVVWVTAEPEPGNRFAGWKGDGVPEQFKVRANPLPVVVSASLEIEAVFLPEGPKKIQTIEDLAKIGKDPEWPLHWTYELAADIDASDTAEWNGGMGFDPIGEEAPFTGVIDGRGNRIIGLSINREEWEDGDGALFAHIGSGGIVRDLGLKNGSIQAPINAGGLALINSGEIKGCYTAVDVRSGHGDAAGFVVYNVGQIQDSYSVGAVLPGGDTIQGGMSGGGLVANNGGEITNSYAAGEIDVPFDKPFIGGLIGENRGDVRTSFWDVEASGLERSNAGRGLTTERMKSLTTFQNAGWETEGNWTHNDGNDYPRLIWEELADDGIPAPEPLNLIGGGTADDPYLVETPVDFALLGSHIGVKDQFFQLTADLDLQDVELHPIGELALFTGTFDGGGHTIANATINRPGGDMVGLFSAIGPSGRVQFLGADSVDVTGRSRTGGVAGINEGTITGCYLKGTIRGSHKSERLGGLVGTNGGLISRSFTDVDVQGGRHSWEVAGFAGQNETEGIIAISYSRGRVTGYDASGFIGRNDGEIFRSYSAVLVKSKSEGAGFAGANWNGTILDSFWDIEVSGQDFSAGGYWLPTANMMERSSYTADGWDFENVWTIDEGNDYPVIRVHQGEPTFPVLFEEWISQTSLPLVERGEAADPGSLGITNLERYAFGLDAANPDRAQLPKPDIVQVEVDDELEEYLTITFWENKYATDVELVAEASDDAATWEVLSAHLHRTEVDLDDKRRLVTYHDRFPLNERERRFLRVKVDTQSSSAAARPPGEPSDPPDDDFPDDGFPDDP